MQLFIELQFSPIYVPNCSCNNFGFKSLANPCKFHMQYHLACQLVYLKQQTAKMATYEICIKIPQLMNSLHKIMFFQLNQKILTRMLEIRLLRYLMKLYYEVLYTFPGYNLEISLKSIFSSITFLTAMLLYRMQLYNSERGFDCG